MSQYVLSVMTSSVSYTFFHHPTPDNPVERAKITIRGGASLPSTKSGFGERTEDHEGTPLWTADGVVTPISEEQYAMLKEHPIFIKHEKAGLVKFVGATLTDNHKLTPAALNMSATRRAVIGSRPSALRSCRAYP